MPVPQELWEQDTPVTMAFIDIDNLKHCNDVFGHDEGNRYILQVSLYLKLYMKVDEAAFRIGGDEFAILSRLQPRTTSPNVWNTAERSCSKTTIPRCPLV
ncbi:MAG: diguanylate cyclase domain-containing protein [Collinsella sp.]